MRTEKSRLKRSLASLQELMRQIRHYAVEEQAGEINAVLRYWRKMLCSRSRDGRLNWDRFNRIKERNPLLRPTLRLPHRKL